MSERLKMAHALLREAKLVEGAEGVPIPNKPGWEQAIFNLDALGASRVVNEYYTGRNRCFFGTMQVFVYGELAIVVQYAGDLAEQPLTSISMALIP